MSIHVKSEDGKKILFKVSEYVNLPVIMDIKVDLDKDMRTVLSNLLKKDDQISLLHRFVERLIFNLN